MANQQIYTYIKFNEKFVDVTFMHVRHLAKADFVTHLKHRFEHHLPHRNTPEIGIKPIQVIN